MKSITLTTPSGTEYTGQLPINWHTISLATFTALAMASTLPEYSQAFAHLTGLPETVLQADAQLVATVRQQLPWLRLETLPSGKAPLPQFLHEGTVYELIDAAGGLLLADQRASLHQFLQQAEGVKALTLAPQLLAVLYKPQGHRRTPATTQATTAAFQRLRVSAGWPALDSFLRPYLLGSSLAHAA